MSSSVGSDAVLLVIIYGFLQGCEEGMVAAFLTLRLLHQHRLPMCLLQQGMPCQEESRRSQSHIDVSTTKYFILESCKFASMPHPSEPEPQAR